MTPRNHKRATEPITIENIIRRNAIDFELGKLRTYSPVEAWRICIVVAALLVAPTSCKMQSAVTNGRSVRTLYRTQIALGAD
jgi:hypothetical protein